eukprot:COSAG03_NODE_5120_length_1337_cov_1.131664_1_plen_41_part_01
MQEQITLYYERSRIIYQLIDRGRGLTRHMHLAQQQMRAAPP